MNSVAKMVPPKQFIIRDISLSFFPGAKIGVLGINGSGKHNNWSLGTNTGVNLLAPGKNPKPTSGF